VRRSRRLAALLAALGVLAATPALGASAILRARTDVAVTGSEVRLGDLGALDGDESLVARLRAVSLGPAPAPGASYRVDPDQLVLRLRQQGIDPASVRLVGIDGVTVSRPAQTLSSEALIDAASAPALARLAALDRDGGPHLLVPVNRPAAVRVATGVLALDARVQEPAPPWSQVTVTLGVLVDGREVQTLPLAFRVARVATVVVAAAPLDPKRALAAADFRVETRPSIDVPAGALTEVGEPADLEATRPVRAGEIVTQHMVRARVVIKRGETVTLLIEGAGFRATAQGQAAEDARRGDVVRVVNPSSKREVVGRVEGPGLVRVNR
jgi:flagella basal body P-ring formation protein FlgA